VTLLVLLLLGLAAVAALIGLLLLRRPRRDTDSVLEVESYRADEIISRLDSTVSDLSNLPAQLRRSRTADPVRPRDLQVIIKDDLVPQDALSRLDEEFATPSRDLAPTLPEDLFAPGASVTPRRKVRLRPERVADVAPSAKDWSPQTGYETDREPTWTELGLPEDVPHRYLDDAFRP
jgi:hypothetical protein